MVQMLEFVHVCVHNCMCVSVHVCVCLCLCLCVYGYSITRLYHNSITSWKLDNVHLLQRVTLYMFNDAIKNYVIFKSMHC